MFYWRKMTSNFGLDHTSNIFILLRERRGKMDGYEALANAIIIQAANDYRAAAKRLKKKPDDELAWAMKRECARFFNSEWCQMLTNADPKKILERLKKEDKNDEKG